MRHVISYETTARRDFPHRDSNHGQAAMPLLYLQSEWICHSGARLSCLCDHAGLCRRKQIEWLIHSTARALLFLWRYSLAAVGSSRMWRWGWWESECYRILSTKKFWQEFIMIIMVFIITACSVSTAVGLNVGWCWRSRHTPSCYCSCSIVVVTTRRRIVQSSNSTTETSCTWWIAVVIVIIYWPLLLMMSL